MKKLLLLLLIWVVVILQDIAGQSVPGISYHLPPYLSEKDFDPSMPSPKSYLGYEVGQWHLSHDQVLGYLRELDRASNRITMQVYGYSHEMRPLVCLTITSEKNHARLDEIRQQHALLADPSRSRSVDVRRLPAVLYQGYSIHGNEASGSHAAIIVAYTLAASQDPKIADVLENVVILLDPCLNPDGLQRFSTWTNSRRGKHLMPDPQHDEFHEPSPNGRTNHYGFDLNRDWLVVTQPESAGRVQLFHDWQPNVLTDHHEMGSNNTFFFQPGVPTRVNPYTPPRNQVLTAKIAEYHARLLSQLQIQFYSGENFDDFYAGKGSTFPDLNGCVGILFEQASSRGSAQHTNNGLLTFSYSIRNQTLTSFSTLQAVFDMRQELNEYTRDFYWQSLEEARRDATQFYVFGNTLGIDHCFPLLEILEQHKIRYQILEHDKMIGGKFFKKNAAVSVSLLQPKYRLLKAMFDRSTHFQDSIFYDISAWTLPWAMGLDFTEATAADLPSHILSQKTLKDLLQPTQFLNETDPLDEVFAYAIEWGQMATPALLAALLAENVRVKVAMQAFSAKNQAFQAGTLLIPLDRSEWSAEALKQKIVRLCPAHLRVVALKHGKSDSGPDLGSSRFQTLRPPKVLIVTGSGAGVHATGEIWHALDLRLGLPPLMVDAERLAEVDLSKINILILADGHFSKAPAEKIKQFVAAGGTVIGIGKALKWLKINGLAKIDFKASDSYHHKISRQPYYLLDDTFAAKDLPGAIFDAELDRSHPLGFGFANDRVPIFVSDTLFLQPTKNTYATPLLFTANPLMAGYAPPQYKNIIGGTAPILVSGWGRGRVICFAHSPCFRAFWRGTERLFFNTVFFGHLIDARAVERN